MKVTSSASFERSTQVTFEPRHPGQSACGGKVSRPQSAHLVVANLPSLRASQNRLVFETGTLNLRVRLRFERRVAGDGSSGVYLDLERTVT